MQSGPIPALGDLQRTCACCASCNAIRRVPSSLRPSAAARLPLTPSTPRAGSIIEDLDFDWGAIGARAKLPFGVHAHMLRHACGYALANAGHDTRLIQDWLGHRAIQHTARYTELSPMRSPQKA
jgi:hypothetical protein